MDLKKLLGLRPKEATAEAIRTAIERAEEGAASALRRAAELDGQRGALLLTGDARAVEAGERELADVRMEAERCGVMATALRPTLAEAEQREKMVEIVALHREAERHMEEFVTWWRTRYPDLAGQIVAGLEMEMRANKLAGELVTASSRHPAAFAASGVRIPRSSGEHLYPSTAGASTHWAGQAVRLPPAEGLGRPRDEAVPFWPTWD